MDDKSRKKRINSLKRTLYYYHLKKLSYGLNDYEIKKYKEIKENLAKINTYTM